MPEVAAGPVTAGDVLASAVAGLRRAGVADPQRTAREVVAAVLGCEPGRAWLDRGRSVGAGAAAEIAARVERIAEGEPVAYATGVQGFRSLVLSVDRRVLIPRPETEGLVDLVLEWVASRPEARCGAAADIGTGSGCVALSLAAEGAFSRVVATDVSDDALAVARTNAERLEGTSCPVEWRLGSLAAPLAGERFHVVVSNPPYVTRAEWDNLELGVRGFEPRLALVSAEDGMAHIRQLLEEVPGVLVPGGLLALEIDARRADAALRLAGRGPWQETVVLDDVFGRPRYLLATTREGS